ncbi:MAG: carbohydrate kinase family protein [Candidatus Thorarchaeota archaeon]|jgi:sugar/nucleoside kinase (ribokinase family)
MEIVVVGHLSRDLIITPETQNESLGGGTAYAMLAPAIGAFGASIISKVGKDFGQNYREILKSSGLDISGLHTEGQKSTRFINEYNALGTRVQRIESVAPSITPSDFGDAHRNAKIIHFSPITPDEIEKTCYVTAWEEGALTSLDAQGYVRQILDDGEVSPRTWEDRDRIISNVDVVKFHDSELKLTDSSESELSAVSHILDMGPIIVIVTRDHRGSTIYTRNSQVDIPLVLSKYQVDSTGCGDTYTIGFLLEYMRSLDISRAGLFAATCASFNAETVGPYKMPDRVKVETRMRSYLPA